MDVLGSDGKESASNAGDLGLIPGLVRSPEELNGYPFQYSCLENSMGRGTWWATVHGVKTERLTPILFIFIMDAKQTSNTKSCDLYL